MALTRRQGIAVRAGLLAALALLAAGGMVLVALVPPTESSFYPKCQLHSLTGLHCPGCGLTRFAAAIATGDLRQAAAYNAVAIFAGPVVAVFALQNLWCWVWGVPPRRWFSPKWSQRVTLSFLAVLMTFFVARNIPVEPFSYLAPHEVTH
jgi:hypothetical protein